MKTSFHRIYTEDGLEQHGLLYRPDEEAKSVLVFTHGMAGNFYENKYLDFIAKELTDNGVAFCIFNNRGAEMLKDTYKIKEDSSEVVRVGDAYEKFEDSAIDIKAHVDFVEQQGFADIHLGGHSLGGPKTAYYVTTQHDERIKSLTWMSPADMIGLAVQSDEYGEQMSEALEMVKQGKGNEFISKDMWGELPLTANTYLDLFKDDSKSGLFSLYKPEDKLEQLSGIEIPVFTVMGRQDDALTVSIEETMERVEGALVNSPNVKTKILGEATHGYRGFEQELADEVREWINQVKK